MDKIINGTVLAKQHEEVLREKIKTLSKVSYVVSILVGDNPASLLYSNLKQKKAVELGIVFELKRFSSDTSWEEVIEEIKKLNSDQKIDGIMVQLPLPIEFLTNHTTEELLEKIDLLKDVDGLTEKGPVELAVVRAVFSLMFWVGIDDEKLGNVAVVGSEGRIGQSLVKKLKGIPGRVIEIDKKNPLSSLDDLKEADTIISCSGVKDLIKPEYLKDGVVLIDVGLGDFDPSCYEKAIAYTPEKGGVGPMTIISLMENVVELVGRKG